MSSFFSGKVIWITGASSGIGEALVYKLAGSGAKLILSARNPDLLKTVATKAGLKEGQYLVIPFNLADTSHVNEYVKSVTDKFGRIDYLINNGGLSQRGEAMDTAENVERNLMEVNYFGHVALSKAVLKVMIAQRAGHITVISSIAGKFGFFLRSSYSAAKHALHGYFESLRLEQEKNNIRVLIVCPGKIRTNISIKASRGDGNTNGTMDPSHENAMLPDECAIRILRAIEGGKKEVFIGGREGLALLVKRLFPGMFYAIIRKQKPV